MVAVHKTSQGKIEDENEYKHTVDLTQTSFTLRANSIAHEILLWFPIDHSIKEDKPTYYRLMWHFYLPYFNQPW